MKSDKAVDIFFLGDTYFGEWHMRLRGRKGKSNVLEEKGYLHFGKNFEAILGDADEVVVNLECAITDIQISPLAGTDKSHIYSARETGTIEALKALNVSTAMLANNHAVDYGKAGLMDTIFALEAAGINYIGGGRGSEEALKPLLFKKDCDGLAFSAAITSAYNHTKMAEGYGFYAKDAVPGVNPLRVGASKQQLEALKKADPDIFYILSPHWGPNYAWRTRGQQNRAVDLLKAGVDLIVGHSAHMIQELEYYDDKLVAYSIGNFIMNGDGEYRARNLPPYSFIARLNVQNIKGKLVKKLMLYPIITSNLDTDFTPRFVDESEMDHIHSILKGHNYDMAYLDRFVSMAKDDFGHYFDCIL